MKILLLGANGQVGQAIQSIAHLASFPIGWQVLPWGRAEADFTRLDELIQKISQLKPDLIINAAAYTQVDRAEIEREACFQINAEAPKRLALYCNSANIPLVHFSSDYVYAGTGDHPHDEAEVHAAQNYYGLTKARGDEGVSQSGAEYLIFRTSWVYSESGKNFVKTMLRLSEEKEELSVVQDQVGSPSYALDLARYSLEATMKALELKLEKTGFPSGIYHLSNSGECSWFQFAKAILPKKRVLPILSEAFPTPAKRPLNSRLDLSKFAKTFGIHPRPWSEALKECLSHLGATS